MFKIVVTEIPNPSPSKQLEMGETANLPLAMPIERYSQTVDAIDLNAVMVAVNRKPRKRRSDAGAPKA